MKRLCIFLILLASSCATVQHPSEMTVTEALARWQELDGKIVYVRGWMGTCWNMDCTIYADQTLIDEGYPQRERSLVIAPKGQNFGERSEFDKHLNSLRGQEIVLKARFDDSCFKYICTDRASTLVPIGVVRVIRTTPRKGS
jgi:hypothetical protein